jgi:hypothetical protein
LGVLLFAAGCATSPAQKPSQVVAPDSTTAATLKDLQAQTVSLAQQNTAIINAIQKSAQDNDQFRTEVKGGLASLTQNQFRSQSWLAEVSDGWRMRVLGISPAPAPGEAGPQLVDGHTGLGDGALPDARSAGAGADAKVAVLRKGDRSMFWLIVAFVLGILVSQVFAALEPQVEAKIQSEEQSLYVLMLKLVHGAWAMLFGKAKATPKT